MGNAGSAGHQEARFYSQFGEDFLLSQLFDGCKTGTFVEIGAFDGRHLSNSLHFEELGWSGICVEPHPAYFPELEQNRPGSICVQAAVVGQKTSDRVTFFAEQLGLLSGVVPGRDLDFEQRYAARGMSFPGFREVEVPALTLDELLAQHLPQGARIDFLSLDTEGNEAEILGHADLRRWRPKAIVVEANTDDERRQITQLLRSKGYVLSRRVRCNLIFTQRRDDAMLLRYRRIDCEIADTLHPLGEQATSRAFRGRRIADRDAFISDNVICQKPDQPFSTLFDYFPRQRRRDGEIGLVHVVNLFAIDGQLDAVQRRTVESMRRAAEAAPQDEGRTVLLQVQAADDPPLTPQGFCRGRDLTRDIRDIDGIETDKPLPLIFDVLDRAAEAASDDDFLIFTNADICLQPGFYEVIRYLLRSGFDAITVNRRTLGKDLLGLPAALAHAENGLLHGGVDCFVFSRRNYERFRATDACVGVAGVARSVLYNMVAFSDAMLVLKNVDLTYHFGNDRGWLSPDYDALTQFNRAAFLDLLAALAETDALRKRLRDFCVGHPEPPLAVSLLEGGG